MPRAVKSNPRVRGAGVTRSTNHTIHPTLISAQVASHAARPLTRRSIRRSRKRGPSGSRPTCNPIAGTTHSFPTHDDSAGAKINSIRQTIKKPRLEDFETDSESEEEDGNDDKHDKVPLEQDIEALEHAHELEASDSSQDVAIASVNEENHSPSLNDNSTALNGAESNIPAYRTPEPHQGSDSIHQIATQPRNRHHGLLGERAGPPFDENIWKDWILTPLELRHSQAPCESEYNGFPDPGPLPPVPCAVRFDIVMRYPAKSLCMIGCARSDVSNGWVVTHSKTLIIENLEAVKFVEFIRYQANEIEITGNESEDTIRLRFDYPHTFEQTIFEHPWLLDFQRRYRSTYSLKSTLSEHDGGETLPRGTLTHNRSWNHRTQGDLSEDAGFIQRLELNERNKSDMEGEEVGKEVEQRKEEK
ncbi:hypothetical protein CCMSSC00406_0006894 [Pleurotus cornucopiae]|uniref:Uncharacterized protein n=1 Tax=Pleurotus cornucopiae TaxID=5321 RepID=A0ACB7ISE3_PLECO|nr:hypothetical protein CCMSSC00406_0006894 [Pleurotus cornucopiae]